MFRISDEYSRRARVLPFMVTMLPIGFTVAGLHLDMVSQLEGLWKPFGVASVVAITLTLCAQLGRDLGREKEIELFTKWGGAPTTRGLRHRTAKNSITLARYHERLRTLVPEIDLPRCDVDEFDDPVGADEKYEAAVRYLRTRTKDASRYRHLFEENCSYGFRRNLWGMRWLGVAGAASGAVWLTLFVLIRLGDAAAPASVFAAGFDLLNVAFLLFWLIRVTPGWVRVPAEAYAERLLETCDELLPPRVAGGPDVGA